MTAPRIEWLKFIAQVIAASAGVSLSGGNNSRSDVLPYNPAILQGLAQSDKGM